MVELLALASIRLGSRHGAHGTLGGVGVAGAVRGVSAVRLGRVQFQVSVLEAVLQSVRVVGLWRQQFRESSNESLRQKNTEILASPPTLWPDMSSVRPSSIFSSGEWLEISILMRWEVLDSTSSLSSPATRGKTCRQRQKETRGFRDDDEGNKENEAEHHSSTSLPVPPHLVWPRGLRSWSCWGSQTVDTLPERSRPCPSFLSASTSRFQHSPKSGANRGKK